MKILVIHGPNLNLLGEREPDIYGQFTLKEVNKKIEAHLKEHKSQGRIFQSNGEGPIIDFIHKNRKWAQGIVINPGAYTHYSFAIRDAITSVAIPTVEVHLSDVKNREEFRKISVISPVCIAQISGLGWKSYIEGIRVLLESKTHGG